VAASRSTGESHSHQPGLTIFIMVFNAIKHEMP
jgi:hypothetical protein